MWNCWTSLGDVLESCGNLLEILCKLVQHRVQKCLKLSGDVRKLLDTFWKFCGERLSSLGRSVGDLLTTDWKRFGCVSSSSWKHLGYLF